MTVSDTFDVTWTVFFFRLVLVKFLFLIWCFIFFTPLSLVGETVSGITLRWTFECVRLVFRGVWVSSYFVDDVMTCVTSPLLYFMDSVVGTCDVSKVRRVAKWRPTSSENSNLSMNDITVNECFVYSVVLWKLNNNKKENLIRKRKANQI